MPVPLCRFLVLRSANAIKSPHVRESIKVQDSGFQSLDSGSRPLDSGFQLSWISMDSGFHTTVDSGFHTFVDSGFHTIVDSGFQ